MACRYIKVIKITLVIFYGFFVVLFAVAKGIFKALRWVCPSQETIDTIAGIAFIMLCLYILSIC